MRQAALPLALFLASACVLSLWGCSGTPAPSALPSASADVPTATARAISHEPTGGVKGFFFLPPLAPAPGPAGEFDDGLASSLEVEVVPLDDSGQPCGDAVATFTDTLPEGSASEHIKVSATDKQCSVNFQTDKHPLTDGAVYRIFVRRKCDGAQYGFADVQVLATMKEAKSLADDTTFALLDGRTLPVKFRISPDAEPRLPDVAWLGYSERPTGEVYVANADGTNRVNVSNDNAGSWWVCLSADRSKVAWLSDRDGAWDIWVANTDGSGLANVTATMGGAQGDWVSISGDGSKVAWYSTRDGYAGGHGQVYVANTDGTGLTNVSADSNSWNDYPSISADGSKVAWVSDRDGEWDIYVANTDGTGVPVNVSRSPVGGNQPSLSSDGSKVAWVSDFWGSRKILVANTDGSDTPLEVGGDVTDDNSGDGGPSLSPDGTKVAWESIIDGNPEVYVANVNGSNAVNVSRDSAEDWDPSLNEDGSKVAWLSNRDGDWDVYVANADGSGVVVNVSSNSADDWFPSLQGN